MCLLVALLSITGCTFELKPDPLDEVPAHFVTYTDDSGLFSISYPGGWETGFSVIENRDQKVAQAVSSIEGNKSLEQITQLFLAGKKLGEGYVPFCQISVGSAGSEYVHNVRADINAVIEGSTSSYRHIDTADKYSNSEKAIVDQYEFMLNNSVKVQVMQMVFVTERHYWLITCTDLSENYESNKSDFPAILESFRVAPVKKSKELSGLVTNILMYAIIFPVGITIYLFISKRMKARKARASDHDSLPPSGMNSE